jgi:hypothetical protein
MKTVKRIVFTLIALIVTISCNEPWGGPRNGDIANYERLTIHAEVSDAEIPVVVKEGFEIDLCGAASACNLSDQTCFSMIALIKNLDATGKFDIQEGEIELLVENTFCNLTGSFSGQGSKIGNNFEIAAIINVNCGTGSFQADAGELRLTIIGTLPEGDDQTMDYELDIDGYLERKIL